MFSVSGSETKLHIAIDQVGLKQGVLMEALQECAESRCTCPTPQYQKLQAVEIRQGPDAVNVTLTAKAGETIDRLAIDSCLEYTASQLVAKK